MNELIELMATRGYMRLPLRRSVLGHLHTDGTLNGRPVEVLVDTGASATVVSLSLVQEIGLGVQRLNIEAGGAGGLLDQYLVEGAVLRLGPLTPRLAGPASTDLTHLNRPLREKGGADVAVILGADVFEAHAAVIDYATDSLFLKTDPAPEQ
ncbi:MAG: clan AA aspartic protease [Betaproteobacteria bacterium]|nr:clan AA aspartic protease [Betaproteobacteria bacterium]